MDCKNCGLCCSYVALEIDTPENEKDLDIIRWYLSHENVWIFIDGDGWNIQFNTMCKYRQNGKCENYEKRPKLCREYSPSECEKQGEGESYIELFQNLEEFEQYLKENPIFK